MGKTSFNNQKKEQRLLAIVSRPHSRLAEMLLGLQPGRILGGLALALSLVSVLSQDATSQVDDGPPDSVVITDNRPGGNPYSETRSLDEDESLLVAGDRILSSEEIKLLQENSGGAPIEQSVQRSSDADGVIIEMREHPLIAAYSEILKNRHGVDAEMRSLSVDEVQQLEEQRIRTMQQQDFVLNRLETLWGSSQPGAQGAGPTSVTRFHTAVNAVVLHGASLAEIQNSVQADASVAARVLRIVPNSPVYGSLITSVPQISVPAVWERTSGKGVPLDGSGVRVGIVDTGVDYTHPDLGGCFGPSCKVAGGYDVVNDDADPMDDHGHGTHCAATAAGHGTHVDESGAVIPVRGVAPGASIYAYKVLTKDGWGTSAMIIGGVERCADPNLDGDFSDHLDVCSLSLGGAGDPDDIKSKAVDAAVAAGVVVVVAAGNAGPGRILSPGTARRAITVAASCKPGVFSPFCGGGPIASFSSRGPIRGFPDVLKPDVAAPGVGICAARFGSYSPGKECLGGNRIAISGTSMATPHVAGVAALLKQAHPGIAPQKLKEAIMASATDLGSPPDAQGAGQIHAFNALEVLGFPNSVAQISGVPLILDIEPTNSRQEYSRTVVLTSTAQSPLEFSASFSTGQEGVSTVITPERVTLAPGESASFNLQVNIDLLRVASNIRWNGLLTFASDRGQVETRIYGRMRDRLISDYRMIDLGVKEGTDLSWRDSATLRLTNRLADASASYQVAVECCGKGASLVSDGIRASLDSDSITIPPGGTVDLPINFEATGVEIEHGRYQGKVILSSPTQVTTIPITLYKGWEFRVTLDPGSTSTALAFLVRPNITLSGSPSAADRPSEIIFLAESPGPWDALGAFRSREALGHMVFNENVLAKQASTKLLLSAADATKAIDFRTDGNYRGDPRFRLGIQGFGTASVGTFISWLWYNRPSSFNGPRFFVNTFGPSILVSGSTRIVHGSDIYTWQNFMVGDSREGDVVLGTDPFVTRTISSTSNIVAGDNTHIWVNSCLEPFCFGVGRDLRIAHGEVGFLHSSSNYSIAPGDALIAYKPSLRMLASSASRDRLSKDPHNPSSSWGVYVSEAAAFSRPQGSDFVKPLLVPAGHGDNIAAGSGPEAHVGRWSNNSVNMRFMSSHGRYASWYVTAGGFTDMSWNIFDKTHERPIRFTLYRNGDEYRTGEAKNGTLLIVTEEGGPYPAPGDYRAVFESENFLNGVRTQTRAESAFTMVSWEEDKEGKVDPNPPTMKHLTLVASGIVQSVIDPTVSNTMYFGLDPNPVTRWWEEAPTSPDELRSVTLEQSADGVSWKPVALKTLSEGEYRAELPVANESQLYSYRVSATDVQGNSFAYTFQVPVGRVLITPAPTPTARPNPTPYNSGLIPSSIDGRLPAPKVRVRAKKLEVTLPAMVAINLEMEKQVARQILQGAGARQEDIAGLLDVSRWQGKCQVYVAPEGATRKKSVALKPLSPQKVVMPYSPSKKQQRVGYTCRFLLPRPYASNLSLRPSLEARMRGPARSRSSAPRR